MDPVDSLKWIETTMLEHFPLGVYRDRTNELEPKTDESFTLSAEQIKDVLDISEEKEIEFVQQNVPERYINPEIKISGFGGQGILLLGATLAQAGMLENYHVSWLPSYGPEMRGGTANCHVNIRNVAIGSPMVSKPNVLIAMNRPSLEKFEEDVEPGGLIIFDNSLIDITPKRNDVECLPIPATKMADALGNTRIANMLTIGAYIGYTGIIQKSTIYEALKIAIKHKRFIDINIEAVDAGYEFGVKHRLDR
jgi:Pyruvate/2-oxoacid:ferredoxin oxidoreductase gamma subunit